MPLLQSKNLTPPRHERHQLMDEHPGQPLGSSKVPKSLTILSAENNTKLSSLRKQPRYLAGTLEDSSTSSLSDPPSDATPPPPTVTHHNGHNNATATNSNDSPRILNRKNRFTRSARHSLRQAFQPHVDEEKSPQPPPEIVVSKRRKVQRKPSVSDVAQPARIAEELFDGDSDISLEQDDEVFKTLLANDDSSECDLDGMIDETLIQSIDVLGDGDKNGRRKRKSPEAPLKEKPVQVPSIIKTQASTEVEKRQRRERRATPLNTGPVAPFENGRREMVHNDLCETCNQPGEFICCDSCPRSFHFNCAEPPVDPDDLEKMDAWYCKSCAWTKRIMPREAVDGIFRGLIRSVDQINPACFSLPDDCKMFFDGVAWDANGDYVDPESLKTSKSNNDPSRLQAEDGTILLCHCCGKSGQKQPLVSCDFCPLYWHVDCISPPLITLPPSNRRWRCPAHADDLIAPLRKLAQDRREMILSDPNEPNNGDVEIVLDAGFPLKSIPTRNRRTTFRLPEESIKLSFINKQHNATTNSSLATDILSGTDANDAPILEESQLWLSSLSGFFKEVATRLTASSAARPTLLSDSAMNDLDVLYMAALGLGPASPADSELPSTRSSNNTVPTSSLDSDDQQLFRQFLAWKRLMLQYQSIPS